MKKILIFIIGLFGLSQLPAQAQTSTNSITGSVKTSATLSAVCSISSQNVSFSQISLPVSAQSATSNMTVQCTKGSSYTIVLSYGGVYGQGGVASGDYWIISQGSGGCSRTACSYTYPYTEYNASGQVIGSENLTNGGGAPPTPSGSTSVGGGKYTVNAPASYTYGMLNGASNGDTIAYSIQVPGNPSEVWNSGEYNYTSTGSGANQSIPVVATLQPANTTHQYPSADTYLDVVTATITY
jgi:spore coat protein U-like protein